MPLNRAMLAPFRCCRKRSRQRASAHPVEGENFAATNEILPAERLHCRRDLRGKLVESRLVDDFDLSDRVGKRLRLSVQSMNRRGTKRSDPLTESLGARCREAAVVFQQKAEVHQILPAGLGLVTWRGTVRQGNGVAGAVDPVFPRRGERGWLTTGR